MAIGPPAIDVTIAGWLREVFARSSWAIGGTSSTPATAQNSSGASGDATPTQARLREHAGKKIPLPQGRRFARNVLKVWPALWTFANRTGVQPHNNHAERALRGAVIYRKLSLGSQSEHGEQRIARLLSAHTTCRLQRRSLPPTSSTSSTPAPRQPAPSCLTPREN